MSAFICDAFHVSCLAAYAVQNRLTADDAQAVTALLVRENVKSVCARYRSTEEADETFDPKATARAIHAAPVAIIKSAKCYAYQACEHEGWETSSAKDLIDAIVAHATERLPGFDSAAWGAP